MARVAAQYAYMVSSDLESPEARYALGPYTPVDPSVLHGLLTVSSRGQYSPVSWETEFTGE